MLLKPSKAEGKGRTDEREFGLQSREKENQILPHRKEAHRILAAGYGRRMEGERAWGIKGDREGKESSERGIELGRDKKGLGE